VSRGHLTCHELIDFLREYLEGELAPEERGRFERHLALCPPCVRYLESYQETVRLGREACCGSEGGLPEDVPEELVRAVLDARARRR
jgi:anti-sigma factor (TIGR02949 family)